jgi:hypothetical protein
MSGASPIVVSGLRFSYTGEVTDLPLCSLLHEVASHINNSDIRSTLHEELARGAPSGRISVTVDSYQEGGEESYTFTSESLQVTLPLSTYSARSVPDLVDSTICLALTDWCRYIRDQYVHDSVRYAAYSGLQTVATQLAQNAALKS